MNNNIKTVEKQCTKCDVFKPMTTDYFGRCSRYGFQSQCKQCKKETYLKNREEINRRKREERASKREVLPEGMKRCATCDEIKPHSEYGKLSKAKDGLRYSCKVCRSKNEYQNNADLIKKKRKKYYEENKVEVLAKTKRYKEENREWYRNYDQNYYLKNKDEIIENVKNNHYARLETDLGYKLLQRCRTRVYQALMAQNTHKSKRTIELIGCTVPELVKHLESQFTEGMTWDNYGEWHVDHIKPCALFDFTDEDQQKECFHYSNLQPLWAEDNYKKSDKYVQTL